MIVNASLPINSVSFGQISTLFLRVLFEKYPDIDLRLSPIGERIDLESQSKIDENFISFIKKSVDSFYKNISHNEISFKLWHINGGLEKFTDKQVLFSFYELSTPTEIELNIVKNNYKVLFSSKYTCDIYKKYGCNNVYHVPLCFDSFNFHIKEKKYFDDRITFNLAGKFEKRKHHAKVIKAWLKKYGNNPKYSLQCSIYNPFFEPKQNLDIFHSLVGNTKYFNINFLNFMVQNELYNDFLNSGDIIIGMSGGEGWGLPEFHSVALGKHSVILNAHSYKDWANSDNSVLVEPSGKTSVYDNVFFFPGKNFNQGEIFDFEEEEFIIACEKAIERVESSRVNENGIKLQESFSSDKFAKNILNSLK